MCLKLVACRLRPTCRRHRADLIGDTGGHIHAAGTVTSEADLRRLSIRNPDRGRDVADAPGRLTLCVHKFGNLEPMLVRGTFALIIGLSLAQCSSTLEKISTESISPAAYQSYTCPDLARADQDLSSKAS